MKWWLCVERRILKDDYSQKQKKLLYKGMHMVTTVSFTWSLNRQNWYIAKNFNSNFLKEVLKYIRQGANGIS